MVTEKLTLEQVPAVVGEINQRLYRLENLLQNQQGTSVKQHFDFKEAAKYVGETEAAFRLHIAQNKVNRIKTGKRLLFLKSDLDGYLENHRVKAVNPSDYLVNQRNGR